MNFAKTTGVRTIALLVAGGMLTLAGGSAWAEEPAAIGSRRELFVDHYLVDRLEGTRLVLHRPHDEGPVLRFDKPWEGRFCGYATGIKDGATYRLYYRGLPQAGAGSNAEQVTCYAQSPDGIHWTKPQLDLFEVQGGKKNNVVLAAAGSATHNFCPFLDTRPGRPEAKRFKAIGGTMQGGLMAFTSGDGIHWRKLRQEAVIPVGMVPFSYMFDSQNVAFWSPSEASYLCYFRVAKDGIRRICRTTSDDFVHWSRPVLMEYRQAGQPAPIEHLYTNQTHPYFRAPHLYVSIAARFMPGRQVLTDAEAKAIHVDPKYFKDTSDAVLMTSRGGSIYDRTFLGSFIRPGIGPQNWVSRTNYPALNVVRTGPTEMSVYLNQDYAQPTAHLRRYAMRLDGFASVQAPYRGGEMTTRPLTFSGRRLLLNFATSAAGGIRVEIQDPGGKPIPGYSLAEAREMIGNELQRAVSWKGGEDVASLAGRPVRLRFAMKDADLYALRFADKP